MEPVFKLHCFSLCAQLCPTLCDPMDCIVHQAPLSMEFFRQEYWRELRFPSPGDLPDPGIKPRSPALQADALPSEPPGKPLLFLFFFSLTTVTRTSKTVE